MRDLKLLTPREREALSYFVRGLSQAKIARQMDISIKTVETYRTRVGQKLGLRNREDLMRLALELGMLHPNEDED
jgi:DNA-binding CsgD family transcriptional regulator